MGKVVEINENLWARLSEAARREGRRPESVLRGLIRDYLETELDRTLDAALAAHVQSSGYQEKDAVRLVREYRRQIHAKPVGKVSEASRQYRTPRSR